VHGSRIYGDYSQETGDASLFRLIRLGCAVGPHTGALHFFFIYCIFTGPGRMYARRYSVSDLCDDGKTAVHIRKQVVTKRVSD
jgi:hypothetical protein